MICPYCEKEISEKDVYCGYCGAKNEHCTVNSTTHVSESSNYINDGSSSSNSSNNTGEPKKSNTTKKAIIIILVVLLCSTIVVVGGFFGVKAIFKEVADEFGYNSEDFESFEEFERYFENFEDQFENEFSNEFGYDFDYDYDYDYDYDHDDSPYEDFAGTDKFIPGKTDVETNHYKSEFSGIEFTLPSAFETASQRELYDMYAEAGISKDKIENHIVVYDFYSVNNLTGTSIEIDYHNKEYYSDCDDVADFNEFLKSTIDSMGEGYEDFNVKFAEDSKINLNGVEYSQLAAQISLGDYTFYEYEFVRELNGYFVDISVLSDSLDNVGKMIDILNGKEK